ncbi:M61 family metallopeptidase [Paracidobacterium acidisoli]|uniref:M61 family peptidase n=1 Tax=Paracidobacterium acidisoli TaxID=2303751 RepID=A0A372IUS2_9BACT|nr:M61 family metallopeptidase [Paracidobacterium acidisoli]MBT9330144.1 M61 family peptidase [Paracidobacterium acidisoli]
MLIRRGSLLPCLAILLVLAAPLGFAQSAGTISLTVDATQTARRILHSHLVIPVRPGPLTLYYPKWIPGAHSPSGPISDLTGLRFAADGKTIPWRRDLLDVFAFHVDVPDGATHLDASFDIIAPRSATEKLLVLEWNEALLYPAGTPSAQLTYDAKLILPEGWKYGTALPVANESGDQITFSPISLNLLVDSPVIAGQYYRAIDITPPGEPIHHEIDIAADSEAALNMSPAMQKEMTNLVAESGKLFGTRHYRDYHFLLHLSDQGGSGGLEHHESQDSGAPERALLGPDAGALVGRLLAHEFVHSWNAKFRRPADLATPDFEKPMEDDLLWVYEGLTDYLGPILAARSGLYTPEQYHEYLASVAAMLGPGRPGRTWRPLLDTAVTVAGGEGGRGARGWTAWRRTSHDYYDEGGLIWLEVATIIHDVTHGQKSIDDFCHVFYGGPNNGPQLKTYTFDSLVETLNQVAPYDWATFFHQHLDFTSPDMPDGGILNAGWKVEFNDKPLHMPGLPARLGNPGDVYTIGLQLGPDGTVMDSVVSGPAFNAGISSGMKVAGVNGRLYTHDVLEDAIRAATDSSAPITLLVINDDYYRTSTIEYHGGERYPHLVRDDGKPDYLDELIRAHAQ